MLTLYERRRLRRVFYSRLSIGFLAVAAGLIGVATFEAYQREVVTTAERERVARELAELTVRKESLQARIEALNNPYGVEEELRSKFMVGREGEHALVLLEERSQNATTATSAPPTPKRRWYDVFF